MIFNRVIQEDSTGCGIACLAMVSEKSYEEVKKILIEENIFSDNSRAFYTDYDDIYCGLALLNIKFKKAGRSLSDWGKLKVISIVAINYREKDDGWHWVVYMPETENQSAYVLDPKKSIKNLQRTDFNKMRLKRYIPLYL